ncbi:hypothetical protein ILT44_26935 [Microvirga sp. BT689]|uniref:hypothetical protein n=1 Tax=Microvirga arvi TaxID=2778731 RepID=UPI0019515774|nr:hypothetical protein [Microvirga arvi]MBM6583840.1 hypothetical protein [Microvirga arvi]
MALAREFPGLTGHMVTTEGTANFAIVGLVSEGTFTGALGAITREIAFLLGTNHDPAIHEALRRALTNFLQPENFARGSVGSNDLLEINFGEFWTDLCLQLEPRVARRLNFSFDIDRYCDWHDNDEPWSEDNGAPHHLEDIIQSAANLRFLERDGRCYYKIDRKLMALVAIDFRMHLGSTLAGEDPDREFRLEVAYLLVDTPEDELWEWAAHAAFRSTPLNLADLGALQTSFVDYASHLRQETIRFLTRDDLPTSIAA